MLRALEILFLCSFAFLAGLVDSIVGGGGLIQLPALFVFLPRSTPIPMIMGTNKLAAVCGTGTALVQYAKRVRLPWFSVPPAAATAALFSMIGARTVEHLDRAHSKWLRPFVLILLIIVAVYTYSKKDMGNVHAPRFIAHHERLWAALAGAILGFYDGFFGPGMGSFLIFVFIGVFGFDFLTASACAKLINVATNLAALATFSAHGHVFYKLALAMGACNLLGALIGTRLAMLKGNRFIRLTFLTIVLAMIVRLGWDVFRSKA